MSQYSNEVQKLLTHINDLQLQIEAMRPINPEQIKKVFQKYRLDWNYNSNSIEGNSLNYGETVAFIMEGLTAKGKPLKDHLDIKGHNDAISFLVSMQEQGAELMERDIRSLHEMILVEPYQSKAQTAEGLPTTKMIKLGEYKSSPNHVVTRTGEIHYYATPEETPVLMYELMQWYRENLNTLNPLILSALFHHRFVNIHPFDDGNGRMSRLVSNLILMQAGLPPVIVRQDQKSEYYGVLSQADAGVLDPLLEYFAGLLIHSLEIYIKGARGEDISDPSDLDKELTLFLGGFDEEDIKKIPFSIEVADGINASVFKPLFKEMTPRLQKINNLFFDSLISASVFVYKSDLSYINGSGGIYDRVDAEEFYYRWVDNDILGSVFVRAVKESYPKDGSVRVKINFHYNGLKAKESADPIDVELIIDFERSYCSIIPFGIKDNDSALSSSIDKSYSKVFTKSDWESVYGQFFRGLMKEIDRVYNKD